MNTVQQARERVKEIAEQRAKRCDQGHAIESNNIHEKGMREKIFDLLKLKWNKLTTKLRSTRAQFSLSFLLTQFEMPWKNATLYLSGPTLRQVKRTNEARSRCGTWEVKNNEKLIKFNYFCLKKNPNLYVRPLI